MAADASSWRPFERLYWLVALLLMLAGLALGLNLGQPPPLWAAGAFGLLGLALYTIQQQGWLEGSRAVTLHLLAAVAGCGYMAAVALATANPFWDAGLVYEVFPAVSLLMVMGAAIFGGWWGLGAGLLLHTLLMPSEPSAPYVSWVLAACVGLLGVGFGRVLRGLDESRQRLEQLAYHDSLTGLPNRRSAQEQYRHHRAIAQRHGLGLWLVVWDLDDLKWVNDHQGHEAGDVLIIGFAHHLHSQLRESDVAFRVGGNEFWSLHFGPLNAEGMVERIRLGFTAVSAGWAECEGLSLEQAVALADEAMYSDKRQRKAKTIPRHLA